MDNKYLTSTFMDHGYLRSVAVFFKEGNPDPDSAADPKEKFTNVQVEHQFKGDSNMNM